MFIAKDAADGFWYIVCTQCRLSAWVTIVCTLVLMPFIGVFAGGLPPGYTKWMMFVVSPMAVLLTISLLYIDSRRVNDESYSFWSLQFWQPGFVTTLWLVLYFLPIIGRCFASIADVLGEYGAHAWLMHARWAITPGIALGAGMIWGGLMGAWFLCSKITNTMYGVGPTCEE